jgi:hypothetical protein
VLVRSQSAGWSAAGVQEYVGPPPADGLMAAQQSFSCVSDGFSCANRADVPGLDVQLDTEEIGKRPAKRRHRPERLDRDPATRSI